MSEVSAAVASPRDRAISDVLFVVQIVCAVAMGTAQIALMLETVQGASITWFAFWFAFLLINLVLARDAHRVQASRVTRQTLAIYAVWSVVIGAALGVLLLSGDAAWNHVDSVTAAITLGGMAGAVAVARARGVPVADAYVRAAFAVLLKAVPQLTLAWNMWEFGGAGVSVWAVVTGHVLINARLWQVGYAMREAGWDRNRAGIAIGEAANELSWIVATVVWVLVR